MGAHTRSSLALNMQFKIYKDSDASVPVRVMKLLLVNVELSSVEDRSSGLPLHELL